MNQPARSPRRRAASPQRARGALVHCRIGLTANGHGDDPSIVPRGLHRDHVVARDARAPAQHRALLVEVPTHHLARVASPGLELGPQFGGWPEAAIGGPIALLQDGDIIEAINDVPLDAPERGLTALAGSQRGARLQIVRAGVGMTRELRVVDGLAWAQVLAQRAGVAPPEPPPAIEPAVLEDMPVAEPGGSTPVASRPGGARRPGDAAYQPPSGASGASAPAASSVQCGSDGACSVARRDFDAMVADPDKLLRQVQVAPSGGGYRLSGIRGGSQVSQLGFRNGDVITAVNGTRLDDQLGLLGLYAGLDSTRSYNVTYQRGGARHTKTIRLRD